MGLSREILPRMENQTEKNMENEMQAGMIIMVHGDHVFLDFLC